MYFVTLLSTNSTIIISVLDKSIKLAYPRPTCLSLSDHILTFGSKTDIYGIMASVGYDHDESINFYYIPQIDEISLISINFENSFFQSLNMQGVNKLEWSPYNDKGIDYHCMSTNVGIVMAQISEISIKTPLIPTGFPFRIIGLE